MRSWVFISFLLGTSVSWTSASVAGDIFVTRTLRANTVLTASDLERRGPVNGDQDALGLDLASLIGQETRQTVFKGQRISARDVAPPALIERNQLVLLVFSQGGLSIEAEGRALDRGREGDLIQVMNLSSRSTVVGIVDAFGAVQVGKKNQ